MTVISRHRRRISIASTLTLLALILSLGFAVASRAQTHAAAEQLTQLSSDPYTNPDSNHKTQVEPDTFAFGNTIVAAFQSGRFFDGGASNIGWPTTTSRTRIALSEHVSSISASSPRPMAGPVGVRQSNWPDR